MKRISTNNLLRLLPLAIIVTLSAFNGLAQSSEQRNFYQKIISAYNAWQSVELNGKLSMDRLPLSPSLRIYMEKGSSILISVRAPFLGEVGRLEVDGTRLTAVNKMKKVYVMEDLSTLMGGIIPLSVEDVQDLLLSRAFLCGMGELSMQNFGQCSLYNESDCWLLIPVVQPADGAVRYGYTFDFSAKVQDLYVTTVNENYAALVEYGYNGSKTNLDVNVQITNKNYDARLQFDAPKWNPAKTLKPVEIDSRWRQVDIKTFVKSF